MARRLFIEWIVLLAAGIALAFFAARWDLANRFDSSLLDRAAALARQEVSPDVVIVAFDDASLHRLGPFPWPRSRHAQLVDRLAEAQSGTVLYDVLFLEPLLEAEDEALAEAIARHGQVILPMTFAPRPDALSGTIAVLPIAGIAESAAGLGHVAITPDSDGVLRRFDLAVSADGETWPQFVLAGLRQGEPAHDAAFGERPVISFHPAGSYPAVSAADVIAGNVPAEFLRDRIVLVGATAQGMGDRYAVGAGAVAVLPGVETQANLYDALRHGVLVRDLPPFWSGLLAALALLVQFLVFWRMSPRSGLIATLAIAAATLALAVLLVVAARLWLAPGVALLAVLLAYPLWSWRRLTSVSAYLDEEAAFLLPQGGIRAEGEGFDLIARQVARMHRLVGHVSRSFAFLRKVIEAAPDAILVRDKAGDVVMANRIAQELFPEWSEDAPPSLAGLLDGVGASHPREAAEITFPDGRTFLVARAAFALEDAEGSGEIMALRDITDTRRREDERREMLEFLSHDMRTPQVAIIGLSGRLAKDEQPAQIASRIRVQAERTLKLADDFVQIARLEETGPEFADCDLGALVEEACDRAYAAARSKQMKVVPHLPEELSFAEVDAALLARLLDNLVGNAIKFAPAGSTVTIALEAPSPDTVRLTVQDEGPGLPPERLADPFARFGAHEHRAGPSVGLGLTFVKRVVDKHGGTVRVEHGDGVGTAFVIDLPQQRAG
ncbi:MAG: CHASE2 domain-containing protein [Erythrobacter sp.]|nr:MAG: CHASE2 domain-containing protein [Erythrobacter sp.]